MRTSGWAYEDVIGKTAVELGFVDESTHEILSKALQDCGGILNGYEVAAPDSEGNVHYALAYTRLAKDWGEEPLLLSIINNITERKQAERDLIESERRRSDTASSPRISPKFSGCLTVKYPKSSM